MDSALVIPVGLPPRLERERRRHVSVAALGVAANLTLLYPFAAPADLTDHGRRRIASILEQHPAFDFRLGPIRAWPTAKADAARPQPARDGRPGPPCHRFAAKAAANRRAE